MGFRKWLDANGGQPQWATGVSPALPPQEPRREVLLDRYESHTKHCSSCKKACEILPLKSPGPRLRSPSVAVRHSSAYSADR